MGADVDTTPNGHGGGLLQMPPEVLRAAMEGKSIADILERIPPDVLLKQIPPDLVANLAEKHGYRLVSDEAEEVDPLSYNDAEDSEEYEGQGYGYARDFAEPEFEGAAAPPGRRRPVDPIPQPRRAPAGMAGRIPDEPPRVDFQEPPVQGRARGGQARAQDPRAQAAQPARDPRAAAAAGRRGQGQGRGRQQAEEQNGVPEGESTTDMLNDVGINFGSMLAAMPGVELGITFEGGGRRVRVSAYYPETARYEHEDISAFQGHVARFGDILAQVFTDATRRATEDMAEVGYDDDGDDEDDDADLEDDDDMVDGE